MTAEHIKPALGRPFGAPLWNEADGMRLYFESNVEHLLCCRHLKVQWL